MSVADIISQVSSALVGAITSMVTAIPAGIKSAFEALFFTTTGEGSSATTTVSNLAVVLLIFGGVALAIGLTKLVWHLVRRKVG